MLKVDKNISINEDELKFKFIRSSGPGGQNVNKVSSAVQLKFDVNKSTSIPNNKKEVLIKNAGKRITKDGLIIIEAKRFKTQEKNRQDSIERLIKLIRKLVKIPKARKKTLPSKASHEDRIEQKKRKSKIKKLRKKVGDKIEF